MIRSSPCGLTHPASEVREHALMIADPQRASAGILALAEDPDARVRFQFAIAAGASAIRRRRRPWPRSPSATRPTAGCELPFSARLAVAKTNFSIG